MLYLMKHPLIDHKLTIMRDKNTSNEVFKNKLHEIGALMATEFTRKFDTVVKTVQTPVGEAHVPVLNENIVLVPILRAGLGMLDGVRSVLPEAKVGMIGMKRDEKTLEPHFYYENYPSDIKDAHVIVLDPMLATGGSATETITHLKDYGVKNITLVCLVGVPEGVRRIETVHPDVDIYLGALDGHLNDVGYIVPGLGDAGDRIFGTD